MVANLYPNLPRMLGGGGKETFLQHRVTCTQQRQLTALLQQAWQSFQHQVQPFLARQAAHHGKQWCALVHLQTHGDLQLPFVLRLLL